jgi:hypothetical protein
MISGDLRETQSLLYIISQVRENIGAGIFAPKYRRSGGKALDHYSQHIFWLAIRETLKHPTRKQSVIGQVIQAKCTKNKITGKRRIVEFPVFNEYGVDDVGACVDFLTEERWTKKKGTISATDFEVEMGREKLIKHIEEIGKEEKLRRITQQTWMEVEKSLEMDRKKKYD